MGCKIEHICVTSMRPGSTCPLSNDVMPLSCACSVLTNSLVLTLSPSGLLLLDCNVNELDSMNSSVRLLLLNNLLRFVPTVRQVPCYSWIPLFLSFIGYASIPLLVLPFLSLLWCCCLAAQSTLFLVVCGCGCALAEPIRGAQFPVLSFSKNHQMTFSHVHSSLTFSWSHTLGSAVFDSFRIPPTCFLWSLYSHHFHGFLVTLHCDSNF